MEPVFTKDMIVDPSICDASGALGHASIFALFQDIASEHAEQIGVGSAAIAARNVFWLTVHTRVQFFEKAHMMQRLTAFTWPGFCSPNDRRCFRYYRLTNQDRLIALGKTEWTIINTKTRRLCPISDSGFPETFLYAEETVCPEPLTRFSDDFTDDDAVYTHIIRASDTDFGGHMNNVSYVRVLLDSFTAKELTEMSIHELEIHFSTPCYEKEQLTIYRKRSNDSVLLAIKKEDGKAAALAEIKLAL